MEPVTVAEVVPWQQVSIAGSPQGQQRAMILSFAIRILKQFGRDTRRTTIHFRLTAGRERVDGWGSPVSAFAVFPPSSRAISARRRLLKTDRGSLLVMSSVEANRSRCLIRSQDLPD